MKKILVLVMVLVLCLTAVGIGYAGWTDQIDIVGTVSTGNVDASLQQMSGSVAYKDLDTDLLKKYNWREFVREDGSFKRVWYDANWQQMPVAPDPDGWHLLEVASSGASQIGDSNDVYFTWTNLMSEVDFSCDAGWEYEGSIPAKINAIELDLDDLEDALNCCDPAVALEDCYRMTITITKDGQTQQVRPEDLVGVQLHDGDRFYIVVTINLPQEECLEGLEGLNASCSIQLIEWDNYGEIIPFDPIV